MLIDGPTGVKKVSVNLVEYPKYRMSAEEKYKYIHTDLHGNALKALYFVLKLGLVSLPEQEFDQLVMFYNCQEEQPLTKEQKQLILAIFNKLKLVKDGAVCYIGDTVADRRWHDGIFLYLLSHLRRIGLNVKIPISNHDMEFILRLEDKDLTKTITLHGQDGMHVQSLLNLNKSITDGIFTFEEIEALYLDAYVPCLIAADYAFVDDSILTIIHGVAGEEELPNLAEKWNVEFKDDTTDELVASINRLNAYFHEQARNLTIHQLVNKKILKEFYTTDEKHLNINAKEYPLEMMIWNRNESKVKRNKIYKGYERSYVHGHDSHALSNDFIFNLEFNNFLGKIKSYDKGKLVYYIALKEQPVPELIFNKDAEFVDEFNALSFTPVRPGTPRPSANLNMNSGSICIQYWRLDKARDQVIVCAQSKRRVSDPIGGDSSLRALHPDISKIQKTPRMSEKLNNNSQNLLLDVSREESKIKTVSQPKPEEQEIQVVEPRHNITTEPRTTVNESTLLAILQNPPRAFTMQRNHLQVQAKQNKPPKYPRLYAYSNNAKPVNRKKSGLYNCKQSHR